MENNEIPRLKEIYNNDPFSRQNLKLNSNINHEFFNKNRG